MYHLLFPSVEQSIHSNSFVGAGEKLEENSDSKSTSKDPKQHLVIWCWLMYTNFEKSLVPAMLKIINFLNFNKHKRNKSNIFSKFEKS